MTVAGDTPFLTSLSAQSTKVKQCAYAKGTYANRRSQLRAYLLFTFHAGLTPFPVSADTLDLYITFLSRSVRSFQTVKNYVDGLRFYSELLGYSYEHLSSDFMVKLTLRGLKHVLSTRPKRKLPITVHILLSIHRTLDFRNIVHVVMWAAMLVCFFGFLRKSNLVPASAKQFDPTKHLTRQSLLWGHDEVILQLFWSKTDQFQSEIVQLPLPRIPDSPLCPVSALRHMIERVPAPSRAPLFVLPHHSSMYTITHTSFVSYVRSFISTIGLDATQYSGHSFRRGMAQYASSLNGSFPALMIAGNWRSSSVYAYLDNKLQVRQRFMSDIRDAVIASRL